MSAHLTLVGGRERGEARRSSIRTVDAVEHTFWRRLAAEAAAALVDVPPDHPMAAEMEETANDLRRAVSPAR